MFHCLHLEMAVKTCTLWSSKSIATCPRHTAAYSVKERLKEVVARIDSVVRARLFPKARAKAQVTTPLPAEEPTPAWRDARWLIPDYVTEAAICLAEAEAVAFSVNRHTHSFTCHKGGVGRYRCRLAYPRPLWDLPTTIAQLKLVPTSDGSFKVAAPRQLEDPPAPHFDPLLNPGNRVVVIELYPPRDEPTIETGLSHTRDLGSVFYADIEGGGYGLVVAFLTLLDHGFGRIPDRPEAQPKVQAEAGEVSGV